MLSLFSIHITTTKNNQQLVGDNPDKEKIVADFQSRLHSTLNSKNIKHYVKSFMT
jgi:protein NDRG1